MGCRHGTLTPPDTWSRPFGTCICSTCRDNSFFRICCYFSGLCSSNIPWYFLDSAFDMSTDQPSTELLKLKCWRKHAIDKNKLICVLWLWHFLYSVGPHPVSSLHTYPLLCRGVFMAGAANQAGDADSSRAPGLNSGFQGSVNVHHGALLLVPQWRCISSFVFYTFVTLVPFAVWSL